MKPVIYKSQVYCIQNTEFLYCTFEKNKIYNISYTDQTITIYDHNNNTYDFHPNSPFNLALKQKYFKNISEIRKEKLKKLNSL